MAPLLCGASEPVRLQPSSQWVLDYADDSCRLIRMFGEGDQQTKLAFESVAPGSVTMMVTGKPLRVYIGDVRTRLLPVEQDAFTGTAQRTENSRPAVLWTYVPIIQFDPQDPPKSLLDVKAKPPARSKVRPSSVDFANRTALLAQRERLLSQVKELEVQIPGHAPVVLETGPLDAAVKAFDQCDRDLMSDLGLDPQVQAQIARPVWPVDPTHLLSWNDYPRKALYLSRESEVNARLLIDANGRVTKCTSLSHFDAPEFNTAVCDALNKATFYPAELADGTKVPSYYVTDVKFRLAP